MPKHMPSHTVHIEIEPGGYSPSVKMMCPWDPRNEDRPCWPYLENGERDDVEHAAEIGCVYIDYVDDIGLEAFDGPAITLSLPAYVTSWEADYPQFAIGQEPQK